MAATAAFGLLIGWLVAPLLTSPGTLPPLWWLVATVLGTTAAVAAITAVPAWLGTRRPPGEVLQSELA